MGEGPFLLECLTHRLRGHYEGDPQHYREALAADEWQALDPILRLQRRGVEEGWLAVDEPARLEEEAQKEVEQAVEAARQSPFPPALASPRSSSTRHDADDVPPGNHRHARRGDARRPARVRARGGRRGRRAVGRHERPRRGVRPGARPQHADLRGGDHRHRHRRRAVWFAPGGRDHVHRLPHACARPAREPGGEGALHVGRPAHGADSSCAPRAARASAAPRSTPRASRHG